MRLDAPPEGSPAPLDALLKKLRAEYVQELPQAIAVLEEALQFLGHDPARGDSVVRWAAHRLAGSGGSYGFPAISAAAREAEHASAAELAAAVERLISLLRSVAAVGSP